jgi:hypothetical protein
MPDRLTQNIIVAYQYSVRGEKTYLAGGALSLSPFSTLEDTLELPLDLDSSDISGEALLLLLTLGVVDGFSGSSLPGNPNLSSVAFRFISLSYAIDLSIAYHKNS